MGGSKIRCTKCGPKMMEFLMLGHQILPPTECVKTSILGPTRISKACNPRGVQLECHYGSRSQRPSLLVYEPEFPTGPGPSGNADPRQPKAVHTTRWGPHLMRTRPRRAPKWQALSDHQPPHCLAVRSFLFRLMALIDPQQGLQYCLYLG